MGKMKLGYFEDFPEITEEDINSNKLRSQVRHLKFLKETIAQYLVEKEKLEEDIKKLVGHDSNHQGRVSYEVDEFNVRITTGWNWSFDKEEYELMEKHILECFNPVRVKTSYTLDDKVCRYIELYASKEEKEFLDKIFWKKPSKLNVVIEEKS